MTTASDTGTASPATIAKGALRRLAMARMEPTPANFARAYAEESGEPVTAVPNALPTRARPLLDRLAMRVTDDATLRGELSSALADGRWDELQRALERVGTAQGAQGQAWAEVIERLARGLERGGRQWTAARKKDSLSRVIDGSRSDAARLQQRLRQLVGAWDGDQVDAAAVDVAGEGGGAAARPEVDPMPGRLAHAFEGTVRVALPTADPRALALADELAELADRVAAEGATPALADAVAGACARARRILGLRQDLVDELVALTHALTDDVAELVEDGAAMAQGLRQRLGDADSARTVRAARELLASTKSRQQRLRDEREQAQQAIKQMVRELLSELGELGQTTGRFNDQLDGYATQIAAADSLDALAGLVQALVGESRAVHQVVADARARLVAEHERAAALEGQVRGLEAELRRLVEEVTTDALTQVANRRGLEQAFAAESERAEQAFQADADAAPLAVALIDIDNFKKLNDSLGHATGDVALKSLAAKVREELRPEDHVARFGGEEFVVMLPATRVDDAQRTLTRLQRTLSASLFMHDGREVFVTFSAGVTAWRPGEPLETALQRADEGLYEAKRTGKNRTCLA